MKLKFDEEGKPVVGEGHMPIWVMEDNSEVAYDVPGMLADLNKTKGYLEKANSESAGRRKQLEEKEQQLSIWEGIDPEEAKKALTTVKNFDESKYVQAGEVEKIKSAVAQTYEERLEKQKKELQSAIEERDKKLSAKEQSIRRMMVKSVFDGSKYLASETVLPSDIAFEYFGKYFEVEDKDGDLRVVAKYNGEEVFSKVRPGEIAHPEEALQQIVEKYQFKDNILKSSGASGSGSTGSGGKGSSEPTDLVSAMYPTMKGMKAQD